jgi:uncharacterized protein (TIGR03083 family)
MLLDQRSDALSPACIVSDIQQLQNILSEFFARISSSDWDRPTEKNGWTLRQTLAHLAASGSLFYQAIECALAGKPFNVEGLQMRADLATFNDLQISQRVSLPPQALVDELLRALDQTAACAQSLTQAQLACEIDVLAYNRPLTVAELLGGQLSHPGIVHAAQLTRAIGAKPLWFSYTKDFLHRQITRSFILMSHSYWPERGQNLVAHLNFRVRDFGTWYVTVDTQGGTYGEGLVDQPTLTLWLPGEDILCQFFTLELKPLQALLTGKMFVWGDFILGLRLPSLFMPT